MPGRPILRKLALGISERANDPENDPEGEGYLFDRVVTGETLQAIADDFGVSSGTLLAWIATGGKPDGPRWRRYMEARELSAFCKEEEGAAILAKLAEDAAERPLTVTAPRVTLATAIAAHKRWQSEKRNRKDFGNDSGPQVTLHIGTMHLDALRSIGGPGSPSQDSVGHEVIRSTSVEPAAQVTSGHEVIEAEYTVEDGIDALL
jgi:hypothetical protein